MTETAQALEPAFAHVALSVSDLHRSVAFYCDGLGFSAGDTYVSAGRRVAELMGIPPTGFAGVFLRCGPVHIELLEYRNAVASREGPPDPRAIGYAHVSVVVASVDDAVAGAIAHGGRRCAQLDHAFGGKCPTRIAFVTDPDHNRVELIEHPDAEERRAHAAFLGSRDQRWPHGRDVHDLEGS